MMKKYEVGYPGEMIGVYYGESKEEAIQACKDELASSSFKPETPARERISGLVAVEA